MQVLFLYPEHQQSDFIQDFEETSTLAMHLGTMFPGSFSISFYRLFNYFVQITLKVYLGMSIRRTRNPTLKYITKLTSPINWESREKLLIEIRMGKRRWCVSTQVQSYKVYFKGKTTLYQSFLCFISYLLGLLISPSFLKNIILINLRSDWDNMTGQAVT